MSNFEISSYSYGSRLLLPFCDVVGLPLDQLNFITCQVVALVFGLVFRLAFSPHRCSSTLRHVIETLVGVALMVFCFGQQVFHMVLQSAMCLIFIRFLPTRHMALASFICSLFYLCVGHIYRQMYDYGGYTLDITGPLMVNTQRLTSLAYSIKDGRCEDEKKLSPNMKAHAVSVTPSLLQFVSYVFSFHGCMCGPFTFYKDYLHFIEGTGVHTKNSKAPSPTWPVMKNLLAVSVYAPVQMFLSPLYPISYLTSPEFYRSGYISKLVAIIATTSAARAKYYFAWSLAEAVNNNAGLGYNGKDEKGREKWDLVTNAKPSKVEFCTSLKVLLDSWNITTTYWLRHVVYERMPFLNTLSVFTISAFWHGFYPGYYLTFFTGSLFIQAGRQLRRHLRPRFQGSTTMAFVYDAITFTATRITLGYLTFPFVLLEFMPSWQGYASLYFGGHIFTLLVVLIGTFVLKAPRKPKDT